MSVTDPIADMLTCIRNGQMAEHSVVTVRYSKIKMEVARILKKEGYVSDFVVEGGAKKELRVYLKYVEEMEPVIKGIKRISKPGLRQYVATDEVPHVLSGMGISILSTSVGIMTGHEARQKGVGGEVLCKVW